MNPLIQGYSGTAPETSRNVFSINQGTNEDDSQSDPHPEAGLFNNQMTQNSGPEDGHDSCFHYWCSIFCGCVFKTKYPSQRKLPHFLVIFSFAIRKTKGGIFINRLRISPLKINQALVAKTKQTSLYCLRPLLAAEFFESPFENMIKEIRKKPSDILSEVKVLARKVYVMDSEDIWYHVLLPFSVEWLLCLQVGIELQLQKEKPATTDAALLAAIRPHALFRLALPQEPVPTTTLQCHFWALLIVLHPRRISC